MDESKGASTTLKLVVVRVIGFRVEVDASRKRLLKISSRIGTFSFCLHLLPPSTRNEGKFQ